MRRRMGAIGIELDDASDGAGTQRWRAVVAARLPGPGWPQRGCCSPRSTPVTGEAVVLDRDSGVDLVDAVAASTSGASAVPDRATGATSTAGTGATRTPTWQPVRRRVVVLSPLGGGRCTRRSGGCSSPPRSRSCARGGSRVEVVVPDDAAEHLFGANAMDVSLRPAAARAGHDQGWRLAGRLARSLGLTPGGQRSTRISAELGPVGAVAPAR